MRATTLASVLLTLTGPVLAQSPSSEFSEIIVEAPRSLPPPKEVSRSPYTGATVVVATLKIPVLYGDLDLTDPDDASRLMHRVERVARDACGQLDRLYPLVTDPGCLAYALSNARPAAQAAIDAAKSGP